MSGGILNVHGVELTSSEHVKIAPPVHRSREHKTRKKQRKQLIVIDGPNVARKHRKNVISVKGIKVAIDYYKRRGFDVIVFLRMHTFQYSLTELQSGTLCDTKTTTYSAAWRFQTIG